MDCMCAVLYSALINNRRNDFSNDFRKQNPKRFDRRPRIAKKEREEKEREDLTIVNRKYMGENSTDITVEGKVSVLSVAQFRSQMPFTV